MVSSRGDLRISLRTERVVSRRLRTGRALEWLTFMMTSSMVGARRMWEVKKDGRERAVAEETRPTARKRRVDFMLRRFLKRIADDLSWCR
jgi:hypothetical protein